MNELLNPASQANGSMFAAGQRNAWYGSLWDTYTANQADVMPNEINFFDIPKGGSKGIERTNMTDSRKLNAGEEIEVDRIRVQFLRTYRADIENILMAYVMTIKYGGKKIFEATLDSCPGGGGVNMSAAVATTAATTTIRETVSNNGPLDANAGFKLAFPYLLKITSGPSIEVTWNCGGTAPTLTATASNGVGVFARVHLDGLRKTLA